MSEPAIAVPLDSLVADYLRVLANERGASAHTLRAYRRELNSFAVFVAERYGEDQTVDRIEHTHIRIYLGTLYDRGSQRLRGAGAGGHSQLVQVARSRRTPRSECGFTCVHAAIAQAPAARTLD